MKTKLFFLLALAVLVFSSCDNNDPKEFKIKDTDMISIRPAGTSAKAPYKIASTQTHLSALDIVKQTKDVALKVYWGEYGTRAFTNEQRDTISATPKLKMWATDVITLDGELQEEWITAVDVVFRTYPMTNRPDLTDTIAYIPNSVLRTAEVAIRKAYAEKDIEACYTIFNTAYTFTPITGAEWRELKKLGQN